MKSRPPKLMNGVAIGAIAGIGAIGGIGGIGVMYGAATAIGANSRAMSRAIGAKRSRRRGHLADLLLVDANRFTRHLVRTSRDLAHLFLVDARRFSRDLLGLALALAPGPSRFRSRSLGMEPAPLAERAAPARPARAPRVVASVRARAPVSRAASAALEPCRRPNPR